VKEGGRPADQVAGVRFLRQDAERALFEAGSGRYSFSSALPRSFSTP
jgi:alpha-L-rhamnosidase